MGLRLFGSSSAGRTLSPLPGDPKPERFKVLRSVEVGCFTVAEILWPDAMNYDGRKIAVYRATPAQLAQAKVLDPHFGETRGPLVPIARFEPTEYGWGLAVLLANAAQSWAK